jgi:hypothetical protein
MRTYRTCLIAAAALLVAVPVFAQSAPPEESTATAKAKEKPAKVNTAPAITIQHLRPQDQRGIQHFEPPKDDNVPFTGFKLDWGAAFTQQFQSLDHENTAAAKMVNGVNANQLMKIGSGFNNASANLFLNAQLAPGIRVALTTYLSSRHHNETWVKDGYLLIDGSPIDAPVLNSLMEVMTIKAGHFEINYGDAHFRRSDNGNGIYNAFVGNYILDAFTTEVGAEVYLRKNGFLAMGAVTGGEIKGNILTPESRSPAYITKLGFDRQVTPDLRVRLTGSNYRIAKSPANTLFAGDRAGSHYFFVLENTQATSSANASSGLINPGFRYKVNAWMINPYVKFQGFEVFGLAETARGRGATETAQREWTQYGIDGIYRFATSEKFYLAGRYNTAEGELAGFTSKVGADRYQIGAGWFITPTILMKAEYVNQKYNDFPSTDIRNGGRFKGFVVEGVVGF